MRKTLIAAAAGSLFLMLGGCPAKPSSDVVTTDAMATDAGMSTDMGMATGTGMASDMGMASDTGMASDEAMDTASGAM